MDDVVANDARSRERGIRVKNRLERAGNSGIWLLCVPNHFNGMEILMEEWQDNVRLRYNRTSGNAGGLRQMWPSMSMACIIMQSRGSGAHPSRRCCAGVQPPLWPSI
jgi:hypothetical protein